MERIVTIGVRETRDYQYHKRIELDPERGLREQLEKEVEAGELGELIWEDPYPTTQVIMEVTWAGEDGATEAVIFNPPLEV
jgi:hypothetical protein